jgi:hypothetical protein
MISGGQNNWVEVADYGALAENKKTALDNAIGILNDRITNLRQDPSAAAIEANRELEKRAMGIDKVTFRQSLIKRILS